MFEKVIEKKPLHPTHPMSLYRIPLVWRICKGCSPHFFHSWKSAWLVFCRVKLLRCSTDLASWDAGWRGRFESSRLALPVWRRTFQAESSSVGRPLFSAIWWGMMGYMGSWRMEIQVVHSVVSLHVWMIVIYIMMISRLISKCGDFPAIDDTVHTVEGWASQQKVVAWMCLPVMPHWESDMWWCHLPWWRTEWKTLPETQDKNWIGHVALDGFEMI